MTRRGIGLIRVSKAKGRDDLISPDLQRSSIQRYASSTGAEIIAWQEALDESGSQARSPWWQTLDHIITRVEAGEFNTVIAWKFNRAARHRLNWAVALDRIERAGATLESATEGVDTSTSTGRFTRGMLAEMAAFEAERIGESWREVKARRTLMGLADGQPRFGYDLIDRVYVPNEWAPTVVSLYEQTLMGVSARQLSFWLRDQGALTRRGNPYLQGPMVTMMRTGFAAGLIRAGDQYFPGVHEPLIPMSVWEQYQSTLTVPNVRRSVKHPLSSLLLCDRCERFLHANNKVGYPPGTVWTCGFKDQSCEGMTAWGPKVIRLLDQHIDRLLAGKDPLFQAELRRQPKKTGGAKRLARIDADLLSFARKHRDGFYDDQTYLMLRDELLTEQRQLRKVTDTVPDLPVAEVMRRLQGAARNDAYHLVFRHVRVRVRQEPKYLLVPLYVG